MKARRQPGFFVVLLSVITGIYICFLYFLTHNLKTMKALKPEVAAKYALMGIRPGKYAFKGFGEIDLCSLTLAKADELFKKGFQFLKLRDTSSAPAAVTTTAKTFPIGAKKTEEKPIVPKTTDVEALRKNKKYVNQLLALTFAECGETGRQVFFNNEQYFQAKKELLIKVSETDREMQSLHAKMKVLAIDESKQEERAELINKLSTLEEAKLELFAKIDTWDAPAADPSDPDALQAKAAHEAIAKQKLIDAHENYIYRNEPSLQNMPEDTPAQKKKKEAKAAEIERRKQELINLGKPYQRKSRK